MKIHEYQAKAILRGFDIPVPSGIACFSADEAGDAAQTLGGNLWAIKAQIHAGGRGKGGGVKTARSLEEVQQIAGSMLGMSLITHQTGPQGQTVRRLLVESGVSIRQEYYLGMVTDRASQRVCLMASSEGGMDIEAVAARSPEKIHTILIDPVAGLSDSAARETAGKIGLTGTAIAATGTLLQNLYRAFDTLDASLIEINPLVIDADNHVIALDAKVTIDDNALFRHPDLAGLRDPDEENPVETEAARHDLSYIALDGNIGCLVNGAGLAMATMDIIRLYGGNPANFLDVGGNATAEKVAAAFRLMLRNPQVKAILVNVFGGIMKCDVIAAGVVTAARETGLAIPLIVRLEGTNAALGRQILADSGLPVTLTHNMNDAAQKAVAAAGGTLCPS